MKLCTNTFGQRVLGKSTFGAAMLACALAGAWHPGVDGAAAAAVFRAPAELPREWQGQPVRPLALSAVEQRFAQAFPGHIARLTDGRTGGDIAFVCRKAAMLAVRDHLKSQDNGEFILEWRHFESALSEMRGQPAACPPDKTR